MHQRRFNAADDLTQRRLLIHCCSGTAGNRWTATCARCAAVMAPSATGSRRWPRQQGAPARPRASPSTGTFLQSAATIKGEVLIASSPGLMLQVANIQKPIGLRTAVQPAPPVGRWDLIMRHFHLRVDYAVFHAPFNRMTRKAVATLADADTRRCLRVLRFLLKSPLEAHHTGCFLLPDPDLERHGHVSSGVRRLSSILLDS